MECYGKTLFDIIETPTGKALYPYQCEAIGGILARLSEYQSTLVVLPTGTGKSYIMAQTAHEFSSQGKVLFLVDQINLAEQIAGEIHDVTGHWPSTERGAFKVSDREYDRAKYIVSTVQTLTSGKGGKRYMKLNPADFSLVIVDEGHCFVNKTGLESLDWFKTNPNCKVAVFTATPKLKGKSIKSLCDSVAYNGGVKQFIDDGWLVKPVAKRIYLESYDISNVGLSGDDLNAKELEEALTKEELIAAMAKETIANTGDEKTIVFCPGVSFAEIMRDHLNEYKPGSAGCIFGHTNKDERKDIDQDFKKGELQYFVNVGVAIKGYNFRGIKCIVDCAPTKAYNRQVQKIGRGLRTIDGTLDGLEYELPESRINAISDSSKPVLKVFDFTGNMGRHKFKTIDIVDILAGEKFSPEVIELVKEKVEQEEFIDIEEALEEAAEEVKKRRVQKASELCRLISEGKLELTVKASYRDIDPFALWDIPEADYIGEAAKGRLPTKDQIAYLKKYHINCEGLTFRQAEVAVAECKKLASIPTASQVQCLQRMGLSQEEINKTSRKKAGFLMQKWKQFGWKPYSTWRNRI